MRHVDEGTLHALLDGALRAEEPERARAVDAHLDGCADCRARLEEAAELTRRAGAVLGALDALDPVDVRPDFHDVLARRDRATTAPASPVSPDSRARMRRRARATRGVAWAASLALALGTGYLIGDRFGAIPGAGEADTPAAPRDEAAFRDAASEGAPDAATETEAAQAEPVRPPSAPVARGAATPRAGATVPERAEAEAAGEEAGPEPLGAAAPSLAEKLAGDETVGLNAIVVTGVPAAEPAVEVESEDIRVGPPLNASVAGTGWRPADAAEAGRLLQGPLLRLPEAELGAVEVRSLGAGGVSVRSVQRLPGGVEVRVTQARIAATDEDAAPDAADRDAARALRRQAAAPALAAPTPAPAAAPTPAPPAPAEAGAAEAVEEAGAGLADAGLRTVTVDRAPFLLVVTGPLPVDALRQLAESASPDGAPPED